MVSAPKQNNPNSHPPNSIIGFMGTALLAGILSATKSDPGPVSKYTACVRSEAALERVRTELSPYTDRVNFVLSDNVNAAKEAQVIILGFQPNYLKNAIGNSDMAKALAGKLVISLLAGKSCQEIAEVLETKSDAGTEIVRVIPSIGAQINESMTLIAETEMSDSNKKLVEWLFNQVGKIQFVPEDLLNTATAVSATCHALTATALDAVVDASVAEGIPREAALSIAAQCLRSSASIVQSGMTVDAFKASMSVPYGITTNAFLQLDRKGVRSGVSDSVRYAVEYANNMK